MSQFRLVMPDMQYLGGFRLALQKGWSPNTTRDVSRELLDEILLDTAAFVEEINSPRNKAPIKMPDGSLKPRLPALTMWMWDGDFCGSINLRYVEGTDELPPYVPGHMGYAVVPWKQRNGYATEALKQFLPNARERGLKRVTLTCDANNVASRKVITANGGEMLQILPKGEDGAEELLFGITL